MGLVTLVTLLCLPKEIFFTLSLTWEWRNAKMKLMKRSDKVGAPYYAVYWETLPSGQKKQRWKSTGTPEHKRAKEIAAKFLTDSALRSRGLIDPDAERFQAEARRTIESHLGDFKPRLQARYTGKRALANINGQLGYIRAFCDHAKIKSIVEITADKMNRYIVHLGDDSKSARTIGAMVGAAKHFTSWLRKHGKLKVDPLETITKPDPATDRRLSRRILKPTEWEWLIRATIAGPIRYEMPAVERCLLYRMTIQTGLRANEVRTLTRGSFVLDGKTPYVKVTSGNAKNRQAAHQYIDADLARDLQSHLTTKMPSAPAFSFPYRYGAKMLQADLAAARARWLDEVKRDPVERTKRETSAFLSTADDSGEVLDFHSLRHTCGAWLAVRGVQPKVIQSVMRHSTITLTLDTYGHLIEGAEAAAVSCAADLTAVPSVIATVKLANNLLTNRVRGACETVLDRAAGAEGMDLTQAIKNPLDPGEIAGWCESLQLSAAERRARESNPQLLPATDFESAS